MLVRGSVGKYAVCRLTGRSGEEDRGRTVGVMGGGGGGRGVGGEGSRKKQQKKLTLKPGNW